MKIEGQEGTVGILPAGALGVAFYYHLTSGLSASVDSVFLVERAGSASAVSRAAAGSITIAGQAGILQASTAAACRPRLSECARQGWLPEVLLACTQSDQILPLISDYVSLLEQLHAGGGLEAAIARLPILVLCSNGIFHLRVRRFLVEALEESTLYGRLPDLWSDAMGRIVGKLLRGVTIQTGLREGQGAGALYRPGPRGRTRLVGGDSAHRHRAGALLQGLGGWFEIEDTHSPTRVELDKALVNLFSNLLGQLRAIDETGKLRLLKVREVLPEADTPETRELARHTIAIGRAVHAYRPEEDFESLYASAMRLARGPLEHVPSTFQWIESQLRAGKLEPHLSPTEKWLLDPLIRYASTAGLEDAANYFRALIQRIENRLALAIATGGNGRAGSEAP